MVTVLVCGEGKQDVGCFDEHRQETRREGWLQPIMRKMLGGETKFMVVARQQLVVQRRSRSKYKPLPSGHGAKALLSKLKAMQEGCDLVVFMADADTNKAKEWKEKREQIKAGFRHVEGVRDLPCVPMSASESWLLSDPAAWATVGLADPKMLPKKPEGIWGTRSDPNGNHPHWCFRRACINAGAEDSLDVRVTIAKESDLNAVKKACPLSFGTFASDLEATQV